MGFEVPMRTLVAITLVAMPIVACQRNASANPEAEKLPSPPSTRVPGVVIATKPLFDEATFRLSIAPQAAVGKGQSGVLVIVLSAKPPFHVNHEYPHRFKVTAMRGLTTPSTTIQRDPAKVTPARLDLLVPVTLGQSGPFGLDGEMSFSLCTEERCLMEKRPLSVVLGAN